jgi:hypothetical protein
MSNLFSGYFDLIAVSYLMIVRLCAIRFVTKCFMNLNATNILDRV